MRIDFHTHVILTKKLGFSLENFEAIVSEARSEGLTAMSLTEHFDTLRFFELYDTLDNMFEYKHDYYDVNGFKIFPGMEVEVQEGGHILIVTDRVSLRQLRKQLSAHETKENFIKAAQLFNIARSHKAIIIGAHPFRETNPLYHIDDNLLKKFDAFDLNGKDLNNYGINEMVAKVKEFANHHGAAVVAGSDTHHSLQMGCVSNKLLTDCNTIEELKKQITMQSYKQEISPCLRTKVRAAAAVKKLLKEKLERLS